MKIHEIIRARRMKLGLTQEQLAGKLGVSAPAVNKWERGNSYPDITLLPVLARTLGVDLNTLLSFQEDLTDQEIGAFLNYLSETGRAEGCGAAFALAEEKLREFPGNDRLAYSAAGILSGAVTLWSEGAPPEEVSAWKETVRALYRRCAASSDPQVREGAGHALISRYLEDGDLEEAEALLSALPDTDRDKPILLSHLRRKQGRHEDAWPILEGELYRRADGVQAVLLFLMNLALEAGDHDAAFTFAETASAAGHLLGQWNYTAENPLFFLALKEQDAPAALASLERMLKSLRTPWRLNESPLYRHVTMKVGAETAQAQLLPQLLEALDRDPECAFLRELPEYDALVRRWQT